MATEDEVETTIYDLAEQFQQVAPQYRSMLPSRRTVQADITDLDRSWHAKWNYGELSDIKEGELGNRPDIRVQLTSEDLVALASGELDFRRAWSQNRIRLDASMTDLLRLRAFL
ncbi:MAG: SCP2 sterol-binding domain-containing protein [Nitriliruptorales bacterium]|nr:SCP2 sterol-binding domain-containing protein [Nitriliruptorales bacterium]